MPCPSPCLGLRTNECMNAILLAFGFVGKKKKKEKQEIVDYESAIYPNSKKNLIKVNHWKFKFGFC